jgi:hypothetical protein
LLLALCPTANTHIIKCLTPATIDAFTKNSPFPDRLGKSMCEMRLQQEHVKCGVDSSFNLLSIVEYQAVIDDDSFESGADLSPLKHQQTFLHHHEQQPSRTKTGHTKMCFSFLCIAPTKKQSALHATTLFRVEDDDNDMTATSTTTQTSPV